MSVELSVVVVARNEAGRIDSCLDGCLRAVWRAQEEGVVGEAEIILSDSASTDRTVEIARTFPVTIVQLPAEWPLSASAGRHVGLRHASGEMLLFVDGDFVILEDWLPEAIRVLRAEPTLGAVAGRMIEESAGNTILGRSEREATEAARAEPEAVPIGLYRRSAVEAAGGFDPFLRGAEDRDLAHRVRGAGYGLRLIGRAMGTHRRASGRRLDYVTYFRSVLVWSVGDGQVFRRWRRNPVVARDIERRYGDLRHIENYLLTLGLASVLLVNLVGALVPGAWPAFALDAGVIAAAAALRRSRRWSWRELAFRFHVVPYTIIRHGGFLLGLVRRPRDPRDYPTGERVLHAAPTIQRRGGPG